MIDQTVDAVDIGGGGVSPEGQSWLSFKTSEGDARINLSYDAAVKLPAMALFVSQRTQGRKLGPDQLQSFPVLEAHILKSEKDPGVVLVIGLQKGGPKLLFDLPPVILETIKNGIAALAGNFENPNDPKSAH